MISYKSIYLIVYTAGSLMLSQTARVHRHGNTQRLVLPTELFSPTGRNQTKHVAMLRLKSFSKDDSVLFSRNHL